MNLHVIQTPHLPRKKVECILIGEGDRDRLETPLLQRGVRAVWLPENQAVDPKLRNHADLSVIHMGGDTLVARGKSVVDILTKLELNVIPAINVQGAEYPADAGLCGCILGRYFIHRQDVTDKAVSKNLGDRAIVPVKQGYTKCAVCVVDEESIITSDAGIAVAAKSHGIEALKIRPGHIALDGYDYGFIGGSTFKLSERELAFTGVLHNHPDQSEILKFLAKKGIGPVFLTSDPIFDIGSAIPLFEI